MKLHTHSAGLILQLASLAFLIIATITSPVLTTIYLAHDSSYKYGVFGYCSYDATSSSDCSKAAANYKPSSLEDSSSNWKMGDAARDKLALILIVAPIAAGLTFISVILNILAHLIRVFVVSKIYWSFLLLFTILSFLSSALVCIVTFLLFYPNVDWPAWCLIPAAVLNMVSIIMVGLAMKILPAFENCDDDDDDEDDEEETEKENYRNDSSLLDEFQDNNKIIEPPSIYIEKNRSVFTVNSDKSDSNTISKNITSSTFDNYENSQLGNKTNTNITSEHITASSFENESTGIKSDAQSSVYDNSLKLPQISNPYLNDSLLDDSQNRTADSNFDSGLVNFSNSNSNFQQTLAVDREGSDSNSSDSNFTSVSQRGINPNYYRGATNKSQFPQSQFTSNPYNQYVNPYIQSNHQSQIQNHIPNQMQNHNQNQQIGGPSYAQHRGNYQQNFNYSSVPQNLAGMPPPQQHFGYQKKAKPHVIMGMKNGYANKNQYPNSFPANNISGPVNNYQRRFGPNTAPLPNQFPVTSSYKGRQKGYMPPPSSISNDGPYGRLT